MFGLQRICQVMATAALGTGMLGAQAAPGCPSLSADALLGAAPTAGASGFALTEKLCLATLVRTPTAPVAVADPEPEPAPVETPVATPVPQPSPAVETLPRPISRDAAGQARIRALAPLMAEVAQRHDIDPLLLHAVAHIESRHQSQAISPAGARGLMQVMPATGRSMGLAQADRELLTPQGNLEASARYLKQLQMRFGNDLRLVLAAYNAGEGAVERHGRRVPPYAETQAYVRDVMAVYAELRRRFGGVHA